MFSSLIFVAAAASAPSASNVGWYVNDNTEAEYCYARRYERGEPAYDLRVSPDGAMSLVIAVDDPATWSDGHSRMTVGFYSGVNNSDPIIEYTGRRFEGRDYVGYQLRGPVKERWIQSTVTTEFAKILGESARIRLSHGGKHYFSYLLGSRSEAAASQLNACLGKMRRGEEF
ncbi:hypothetical protein AAG612_08295 [Citromicrobium bathyomarinum]|uniref:hypothetical protein n=1 Tax=Citromicrobium bathyomarinum TaxID=72174 RepID=UPI00315AE0FC